MKSRSHEANNQHLKDWKGKVTKETLGAGENCKPPTSKKKHEKRKANYKSKIPPKWMKNWPVVRSGEDVSKRVRKVD